MKRLSRTVLVDRDPEAVFGLVSDPDRLSEFFVGMTRWDPRSRRRRGKDARYRVLMRVGSIEAGGVVRITEWQDGQLIAWESETGIEQRGRWRLRAAAGGTELTLEVEFSLQGPGSALVERIAGRIVGRNMTATLLAARRVLEFEKRPGRTTRPVRAEVGP